MMWCLLGGVCVCVDEVRPELREYEVVRPVRLHTHQRRDTQVSHSWVTKGDHRPHKLFLIPTKYQILK